MVSYMNNRLRSAAKQLLLTLPSLGWLLVFFLLPAIVLYAYAFTSNDPALTGRWTLVTLHTLVERRALYATVRTIVLSMATTIISVCLALPVAYTMATARKSSQRKLLLLIVTPLWTSFLVRIFAWKVVLHPEGVLKGAFVYLGIVGPECSLLYNSVTVLLVMCYSYLPFAILPLYSAASKFNFPLFEAALDLGATKRQAFYQVFLPAMKGAIVTASLMVLIPAAGAYVIPEIVGGQNSELLGNVIAQKIFLDRDLPQASALALLLAILLLIPSVSAAVGKLGLKGDATNGGKYEALSLVPSYYVQGLCVALSARGHTRCHVV